MWGISTVVPSVRSAKLSGSAIRRSAPSLSNHWCFSTSISMYRSPGRPFREFGASPTSHSETIARCDSRGNENLPELTAMTYHPPYIRNKGRDKPPGTPAWCAILPYSLSEWTDHRNLIYPTPSLARGQVLEPPSIFEPEPCMKGNSSVLQFLNHHPNHSSQPETGLNV